MGRRKRPPLTEAQWREVFAIRCRSKRGEPITKAELALCTRAMKEDEPRYSKMDADVFDATVPFGSNVRASRGAKP